MARLGRRIRREGVEEDSMPAPATAVRLARFLTWTLLAAALPANAATTRTQDHRLVWGGESPLPEGSHFGTRLDLEASGASGSSRIAMVSAPDGAGMGLYYHSPAQGWRYLGGSMGAAPQSYAVDIGLIGGSVFVRREGDGSYTILDGGGQPLVSGIDIYVGAVAIHGDVLVVGQPAYNGDAGRIRIYELDSGNPPVTFFGGPLERLGESLAIGEATIVAGAPGSGPNGAVYAYQYTTEWVEWQRIESPAASQTAARFGAAVALDDGRIAVGSPDADRVTTPGALTDVGAVYLYEWNFLSWEFSTLLRPAGATHFDHFGAGVSMAGGLLAAGAPGEDGASVDEGAAFVYQLSGPQWRETLRLEDGTPEADEAVGTAVAIGDRGAIVGAPSFDGNGVVDQGAVLFFGTVFTLFADGFESGDTSAWSSTAP
jgi:hypothetical protein